MQGPGGTWDSGGIWGPGRCRTVRDVGSWGDAGSWGMQDPGHVVAVPLTLLHLAAGRAGGEGAAEIPPGHGHVALCHRPVHHRPQRGVPRLPHRQRRGEHRDLPEPPLHRDLRRQPEGLPSASVLRGEGRVPRDRVLRRRTRNRVVANVFSPISLPWRVSAGSSLLASRAVGLYSGLGSCLTCPRVFIKAVFPLSQKEGRLLPHHLRVAPGERASSVRLLLSARGSPASLFP